MSPGLITPSSNFASSEKARYNITPFEKITTVFFDFGDTLAYVHPSPLEIWLQLARELGLRVEMEALQGAHQEATEFFTPKIYEYKGRMEEFWLLFDSFILDKLGISDPDGRLAKAVYRGFQEDRWIHLYPETREALEALRKNGYQLGMISNNTDDLLRRLKQLDLEKYFDSVTYSQEAGAEKPNPLIFQLALKRAQCVPQEAVHVGNSYEHDVVGAQAAGITPILIDRDDHYPKADCLRIRDLRELEAVLASVSRPS